MILRDNPRAYAIMGCAKRVYATLGFGFLESAYGDAMEIEFAKAGIPYVREDPVRIYYDGKPLPTVWRADFTCFGPSKFFVETPTRIKEAPLTFRRSSAHLSRLQFARHPCFNLRLCRSFHSASCKQWVGFGRKAHQA